MGSPLAPVLANLFMGHHEKNWIDNFEGSKPIVYRRYVDDIFCLFDNENEASLFLVYLNKQHPNIKFTSEPEKNGKLPFLDVNIEKKEGGGFLTSIFHKSSYTGLLTNFLSFTPLIYKLALVKTLIHRIYKICNSWKLFHENIVELKETLKRNKFPEKIIDSEIKKYLNKTFEKEKDKNEEEKETRNVYILPFLGSKSKITQSKVNKLSNELCKATKIKLIFSVCKIKSCLPTKSKAPSSLLSGVVYRYICPICGDSYIGETTRHFEVRRNEHLNTDKTSTVYKHTHKNNECRGESNETSFSVIDKAKTQFSLKIKQAIYINKYKPTLINKQINHVVLTLGI